MIRERRKYSSTRTRAALIRIVRIASWLVSDESIRNHSFASAVLTGSTEGADVTVSDLADACWNVGAGAGIEPAPPRERKGVRLYTTRLTHLLGVRYASVYDSLRLKDLVVYTV